MIPSPWVDVLRHIRIKTNVRRFPEISGISSPEGNSEFRGNDMKKDLDGE